MKKNYLLILIILLCTINIDKGAAQNCVDATIQITTSIQTSPPSITFTWAPITGSTSIKIYRKTKTAYGWGTVAATLSGTATSYSDNTVALGGDYEYKIWSSGTINAYTYVYAGIKYPQVDYRGKIILLVDNTFAVTLASELKTLISDMIGDGWQIIRHDVSRTASPPAIKALIGTDYNADPANVKGVFLFGHVPVPYSGDQNPDGHPSHLGAWPADGYYVDFISTWTDTDISDTLASRPENQNRIGDGKFDQTGLDYSLGLQIGRVDLSNMPSFSSSEEQLLRQYLNKDHNYKQKVFNAARRALIDDNFGYFSGEAFASSGWRNFTAMFRPDSIKTGDYFGDMSAQSYLWSYGCGSGSFTSCNGIGSTSDFSINSPKSVFTMMFGSYFGDWDSQDNILRAPLASSGWGLTSSWSGRPYSIYHHMALGETVGFAGLKTMQNSFTYTSGYFPSEVTIGLMGDPTLRMHTIAPPVNVAALPALSHVNLSWTASSDSVLGYCVYREDTVSGKYNKINSGIITGTNYIDSFPLNHVNYYMVRAVKLEISNSGSYYNLSQGAFDTASINLTGITDSHLFDNRFRVYPNPAKDYADFEFRTSDNSQVRITLFDMMGKEIKTIVNTALSPGFYKYNLNTKELSNGIYICSFKVNDKIEYKKLIVSE